MKYIRIKGAREHNLKAIDLELPRDRLIVISISPQAWTSKFLSSCLTVVT
jgi:excinuclease UvrABC ATPase subunit